MTPVASTPAGPADRNVAGRGAVLLLAVLLVTSLLLAGQAPAADAAPATCSSTPFRNDTGKKKIYRIPSLVTTTQGSLLAFAERRRSTDPSSDLSDTEIVVVRSTDRGCHWSSPKVIADRGSDTVGNPVPLVDRVTGTVLLFSVDRPRGGTTYHGLHLQRSTDDGRTFTPYGQAGHDLAGTPRYSGGLTGPGHAIQLSAAASPHPGRLVVPLGYKEGNRYGAYVILSDDHGATWRVGFKAPGSDGRIEGTVAELPDGRLWISYRNRNAKTAVGSGRIAAFSSDGGTSLDVSFKKAGLPVVSVQGSGLGLTGRYAGTLVFSSPAGKDRTKRQQMAIFSSRGTTVGTRWAAPYRLQSSRQPAAYSDLTQIDDATLGIVFETGKKTWHERIDYRSLRIADVLR